MSINPTRIFTGFSIILITMLTACYEVPENKNIPYAAVSFIIDTETSDNSLREGLVGNSKVFDAKHPAIQSAGYGIYGYSGVVVTRAIDDKLYAFDCCCPYEAKKTIVLDCDGFFMKCPECGSKFEIGNGSGLVNKGPATQILKAYRVVNLGINRYKITN